MNLFYVLLFWLPYIYSWFLVCQILLPDYSLCLFEVFSGGFVLLEQEMISFLRIIFKVFFREAGFRHYLRMISPFFLLQNLGIRACWILQIVTWWYLLETGMAWSIHREHFLTFYSLFACCHVTCLCSQMLAGVLHSFSC